MAKQTQTDTAFDIRKIYLKDASVESPNAPGVFLNSENKPKIDIEVSIKTEPLEQENYYEVVLGITVTSKIEETTAFLVEVQQAGVFQIAGLPEADLPLALEIACPNMLLPFAREAISDLIGKAGFPQLLISPINFESLYHSKLQELEAENAKGEGQGEPTKKTTH